MIRKPTPPSPGKGTCAKLPLLFLLLLVALLLSRHPQNSIAHQTYAQSPCRSPMPGSSRNPLQPSAVRSLQGEEGVSCKGAVNRVLV